MVCHSLSYYWKDTRLKVYIWQPFEARIIETWRPNSETPGLQFKNQVPTGVDAYYCCCLCAHLLFVVWSQFVGEKRWVPERMDAYYCCCLCACCCLLVKKDANIIVACAPDAPAEEIRSRVPPVPTPPYLFKQKERFCQCHWNTISEEKEIQLFRCTDKDVYSDKGDNERTPPVNAVASISSIKYVNWPRFKIWQIDQADWGRRIMAC